MEVVHRGRGDRVRDHASVGNLAVRPPGPTHVLRRSPIGCFSRATDRTRYLNRRQDN